MFWLLTPPLQGGQAFLRVVFAPPPNQAGGGGAAWANIILSEFYKESVL